MIYKTSSTEQTEDLGQRLALFLEKNNKDRAFIAMRGEMGVGKTAFTRGFARQLGICSVKSPTYTVVNEYKGKIPLFHFDMYRIESGDDLYSIGYDDYIERRGFSIVEWSENIEDDIPADAIFVTISRCEGGEDERNIEIDLGGEYSEDTCI